MNHINQYLDSKRFSPSSKSVYGLWLDRLHRFARKETMRITQADLNGFYEAHSQRYAPKTMQLAFNIYHAYFKFWGGEEDCINHERIDIPKARAKSHYSITKEEHLAMMHSLRESDFRQLQQKLIISLLYDTGMRVAELTSIRLQDISEYEAVIETKKTSKSRTVFWGYVTQKLLERYMGIRQEMGRGDRLLVGLYRDGRYSNSISTRSVERIIRRVALGAGIKSPIVPHSYRHSRIRRWFDTGLQAHQIILMSGHESIISLEKYMRLGIEPIRKMANEHM